MKLYTSPFNVYNSARVLATLFEKDATEEDFQIVKVDMLSGAHKEPQFLRLQPFGKLPALEDGDLALFESRAIMRFVERKFEGRGTPLFGFSWKDRALASQWLEVEGHNYNPLISTLLTEKVHKPGRGEKTSADVVQVSVQKLHRVLDVYEQHLAVNRYLAGSFFSIADVAHLPETNLLFVKLGLGELISSRPHVKAWWDDISSRPSWKKVLDIMVWA